MACRIRGLGPCEQNREGYLDPEQRVRSKSHKKIGLISLSQKHAAMAELPSGLNDDYADDATWVPGARIQQARNEGLLGIVGDPTLFPALGLLAKVLMARRLEEGCVSTSTFIQVCGIRFCSCGSAGGIWPEARPLLPTSLAVRVESQWGSDLFPFVTLKLEA